MRGHLLKFLETSKYLGTKMLKVINRVVFSIYQNDKKYDKTAY